MKKLINKIKTIFGKKKPEQKKDDKPKPKPKKKKTTKKK